MMTRQQMIAGLNAGRTLIQEEWADHREIEIVDALLKEGIAKEEDGWRWHENFQCERRCIVKATSQ